MALSIYLTIAVLIIGLSHEPDFAYMPYLFAAVLLSVQIAWMVWLAPAIAAVVTLVAVMTHKANAQVAAKICSSLGATMSDPICQGGLTYCGGQDLQAIHNWWFQGLFHGSSARITPLLGLIALLPIVAGFTRLWRFPELRYDLGIIGAASGLSFIFTPPLFWYASDWGRWIMIHVTMLMLLLLYVNRKAPQSNRRIPPSL